MGKGFKKWIARTLPRDAEDSLVKAMLEDGFYLGGSRSKAPRRTPWGQDWSNVKNSDWDFSFSAGDIQKRHFLLDHGFERQELTQEHADAYSDITFYALYKHSRWKVECIGRVPKYYETYKRVWDSISSDYYYHYLWKSAPHRNKDRVGEHKVFIQDTLNLLISTNYRGELDGYHEATSTYRHRDREFEALLDPRDSDEGDWVTNPCEGVATSLW